MPRKVIINGNTVTAMNYNGQPVRRCFFNGVTVFPSLDVAATQPTTKLTSNTAPSPYTVYYSSVYSSTYAGYKAFQNAVDSRGWASCSNNVNGVAWIALDLGSGKKLRDVIVSLWNRNNSVLSNVNGPYNVTVYGSNTKPTNGTGSTYTAMPSDAMPLGVFTGLAGATASAKAVLDCVGNTTSGATRSTSYVDNTQQYGFRYIIVSSTSWSQVSGTAMVIGCIKIDGNFET